MTTLDEIFPPLPDVNTHDAARDASLRTLEGLPWSSAAPELEPSAAFDALAADAAALPHLLARFELATRVGDVKSVMASSHPLYRDAWAQSVSRMQTIFWLARAIAAHHDPRAEAKLLDVFLTHAWPEARQAAGAALAQEGATEATYEAMATMMAWERPGGSEIPVRDLGILAAFRMAPETAFERLAPVLEAGAKDPSSYVFQGFYAPLIKPGTPLDPRWYGVLVRLFETDASPEYWLTGRRAERAAVEAVKAYLDAAVAGDAPWGHLYGPLQVLLAWELAETAPQALAALKLAIARGKTNFELTTPLEALTRAGDPGVLPALDAIAETVQRKAKQAVLATVAALEARLSPEALEARRAAAAPPKKKGKAKASPPEDADRASLRAALAKAGLSDARADEIVALARPRILLSARPGAGTGASRSRFGGAPDLAPGEAWPALRAPRKTAKKLLRSATLEETPHAVVGDDAVFPMTFVGQVDLAEVAPLDREGRLPREGLLSFFVRQDLVTSFKGDLPRLASAVLFTRGETAPATPPAGHDTREVVAPCAVTFARDLPVPPGAAVARLGLMQAEHAAFDAVERPEPAAFASMLGWARAMYYRGLPRRGETLLLGISSDSPPGFTFGDDSSIFFSIKDAQLDSGTFEEAVADADEG